MRSMDSLSIDIIGVDEPEERGSIGILNTVMKLMNNLIGNDSTNINRGIMSNTGQCVIRATTISQ